MAAKAVKKEVSRSTIVVDFMEYVLENDFPKNVYAFSKACEFSEAEFYNFFGSIDGIKKAIWVDLFNHVEELLFKNEEYSNYASREKLLSFYFTFFELLTANRSYVLFALKEGKNKLESLKQLSDLRKNVVEFGKALVEADNENQNLKFLKKPVSIVSEATWLQFLFLLKFWMNDDSQGFEKTDVAIEKSVNTVFDVLDNTPLDSIIDFGKFLWKEKMA